jgi:20S proteasome subunit beta 7
MLKLTTSCFRSQYQIATITDAGIDISASRENQTEWKFAEGLRGYGPQKQ